MQAIVATRPGAPDVLVWSEVAEPRPTSTDVIIDVLAAGLNNADLLQRRGHYPVPPDASPLLGLECAGVISWVGEDVKGWSPGDRVCALLNGGGYAERVAVNADLILPMPHRLSAVQAAALPEATCTVYSNLAIRAELRSGMTLLVHGGGSGIGTTAIQWAKAIGARVFTTVGSDGKGERCRELGADPVINYRSRDFVEDAVATSGGRGVDVILDIVGAEYLERNIRCLAPDGHLVVIGNSGSEPDPALNLRLLMSKRGSVSATMLRGRPHDQKAKIVHAVREHFWPLIEDGHVTPVIDTVFPMEKAAQAHALLESGRTFGKVVLTTPTFR